MFCSPQQLAHGPVDGDGHRGREDVYLRNVESRVKSCLGRLRLWGLRVDGGQNAALGSRDLARDSGLLFGTHLDRSVECSRLDGFCFKDVK